MVLTKTPITRNSEIIVASNKKKILKKSYSRDKLLFAGNLEPWYKKSFHEFCTVTSLHGYNYTVLKNSPKFERMAWCLFILLATIISIVLVILSYQWSKRNTTATLIENTHYPTWNIPFPAVTICNVNKISYSAALRVASTMKRPNGTSIEELLEMFKMLIHYEGIGQASEAEYMEFHRILVDNKLSVMQLLTDISPKCSNMLLRCIWKGTQFRCETIFQQINTSYGICCSFNNHAMKITNYGSLSSGKIIQTQVQKVITCGYQTGLTVLIKPSVEDYFASFISIPGFRIFIHSSYDFADDNAETKYISAESETFISMLPEYTFGSPAFKQLTKAERGCFLYQDNQPKILSNYSYVNCMSECKGGIILKLCGCVPYNTPNNGSLQICEMNNISCFHKYKFIFNAARPGTWIFERYGVPNLRCICLPDCDLPTYGSEVTSAKIDREYSANNLRLFKGVQITDESLVHIFFNDLVSTLYRREVTESWLSILASFGGLLGLFLGFSFIAVFEVIYLFTFRPIFQLYRSKIANLKNKKRIKFQDGK